MRTSGSDIADFYKQVSLLLKSGLPMADSIRQLGMNFEKPDFKEILLDISENVSRGETLSGAMARHPAYFTKFQTRMVEAGEKSEMLPETLAEIANSARFDLQLVSIVRDIAIYPVFAMWFAFVILFYLMTVLVPEFKAIFDEMLGGEPLPALTELILELAKFFVRYLRFFVAALAGYVVFFIWLFGGTPSAKRLFLRVISFFPGAGSIYYNLNIAKLCALWSVLMRQEIGTADSLRIVSSLIDSRRISESLQRAARSVEDGTALPDALRQEKAISGMIPLTVAHVPENELPQELANLAVLFRDKSASSTRVASALWGMLAIIFLSVSIGTIVIAMFMPLISIFTKLSGG
ncbi:MAG: type II secretion system F family protein [Victivallales bacterium]|nr:type II secretion system F family protein [Victivallales bacterium]